MLGGWSTNVRLQCQSSKFGAVRSYRPPQNWRLKCNSFDCRFWGLHMHIHAISNLQHRLHRIEASSGYHLSENDSKLIVYFTHFSIIHICLLIMLAVLAVLQILTAVDLTLLFMMPALPILMPALPAVPVLPTVPALPVGSVLRHIWLPISHID